MSVTSAKGKASAYNRTALTRDPLAISPRSAKQGCQERDQGHERPQAKLQVGISYREKDQLLFQPDCMGPLCLCALAIYGDGTHIYCEEGRARCISSISYIRLDWVDLS